MSKAVSYQGFDIVKRWDGSYVVYDFGWWPDEVLDADPDANAAWLAGTEGWRVKGWQVVHVAGNFRAAHDWAYHASRRN